MPKLSIVTINYNNKNGLEKTIESVINQTYQDFEYIIIDGGSTDGSKDIIKKYKARLTHWISEPDNGIYHAMNKGWKQANGEYFLFLNSGDYLYSPTIINVIIPFLTDIDVLYGDTLQDFGYKKKIENYPDDYSLYNLLYTSLPHQASFIHKRILEKLDGYDESFRIISDWLLFFRGIIELNIEFKKIKEIISVFDMHGISNTLPIIEEEKNSAINKYHPFILKEFKNYKELRYYKLSKAIKLTKNLLHLINKK